MSTKKLIFQVSALFIGMILLLKIAAKLIGFPTNPNIDVVVLSLLISSLGAKYGIANDKVIEGTLYKQLYAVFVSVYLVYNAFMLFLASMLIHVGQKTVVVHMTTAFIMSLLFIPLGIWQANRKIKKELETIKIVP